MAVKVRERPPGSGRWWVFTDWKNKRSARFIAQGKRAAEEVAKRICEKLDLVETNRRNGVSFSFRELVLGQPDPPAPSVPPPTGPLFGPYAESWLEGCEARGLKHTTHRAYKVILETHLTPTFGEKHLSEIDRKAVREFAMVKRDTVIKRKTDKEPEPGILAKAPRKTSARTVQHILCCLSSIFNQAIEDGLVQHNPALKPGKILKGKAKAEDVNPFSREEEAAFLKAVAEHCPTYSPLFLTLLRTGCRIGEAIALQPGDLDFHGRFIQIRRNFTNGRLTTPKNGKSRRVDLSTRLADVLQQHLVNQELEALGQDRGMPEWLFCNDTGNMLDPDNVRHRVFYKLLEKSGLRRIRIHDLRHTFATRLLMNGESPAYVKEQMGHSSIQVTVDLYCHWIPGSNRQAVDRLDDAVDIPKFEGQSATIRNQAEVGQGGEERFPMEVLGNFGAGDPD
ncbi:MAG TPA: tyrosine-type recombinase/integrase [Nitrospiraceae bacterium]|nr:tyrosine-type recombinase/integrase [Nitrospiraceae bacterium]